MKAAAAHGNAVVAAMAQLANTLEMSVVAKGVESEEQAKILRQLGCRLGQGYHFSRAVNAAQIESFLRSAIESRA